MTPQQKIELIALMDEIDQFGYGKFEVTWDNNEIVKIYAGRSYKPKKSVFKMCDLGLKQGTKEGSIR
mgnify:CR=1 FL=1